MLIGVISDTHGYYDPRVCPLLQGVEHILHAGDIGTGQIIEQLSEIAPVTAVRGNNDRVGPESQFPEVEILDLGGRRIYLTHIVKVPKVRDEAALATYIEEGVDAVVFGHSHMAFYETREVGSSEEDNRRLITFFNPGAAGKRRFKVVPSIGLLEMKPEGIEGRILVL